MKNDKTWSVFSEDDSGSSVINVHDVRWNETGQAITKMVTAVWTGLTVPCGEGQTHEDSGLMPDLSQLSELSRWVPLTEMGKARQDQI